MASAMMSAFTGSNHFIHADLLHCSFLKRLSWWGSRRLEQYRYDSRDELIEFGDRTVADDLAFGTIIHDNSTYGRIIFSSMHKHHNKFGFMLNLEWCKSATMYAARRHEANALEYECLTKGTSNFAFSLQIMNPSLCYYITIAIPNLQQVPWIRKATSCSTASLPNVLLVQSLLSRVQTLWVIKRWHLQCCKLLWIFKHCVGLTYVEKAFGGCWSQRNSQHMRCEVPKPHALSAFVY